MLLHMMLFLIRGLFKKILYLNNNTITSSNYVVQFLNLVSESSYYSSLQCHSTYSYVYQEVHKVYSFPTTLFFKGFIDLTGLLVKTCDAPLLVVVSSLISWKSK